MPTEVLYSDGWLKIATDKHDTKGTKAVKIVKLTHKSAVEAGTQAAMAVVFGKKDLR